MENRYGMDAEPYAALQNLLSAIEHDIDNPSRWQALTVFMQSGIRMPQPIPRIGSVVLQALGRRKLWPELLDPYVYPMLVFSAEFQKLREIYSLGQFRELIESDEAARLLNDKFILMVLQVMVLHTPEYEQLLTDLRKALLLAVHHRTLESSTAGRLVPFTCALACYALKTEFALYVTEEEEDAVAECKEAFATQEFDDDYRYLLLAIIGCYELLDDFDDAHSIFEQREKGKEPPVFGEMIHLHIERRRLELSYRDKVEPFCDIDDDVSQIVQQMYEENPYPRWTVFGKDDPVTFRNWIRRVLPFLREDQLPENRTGQSEPLDVLIAGCGTGKHALSSATRYLDSQVLAIDLSGASLAYATMMADQHDVDNITFRHGDILKLPTLNRKFDIIEEAGSLHHMGDPKAGLEAIDKCLKPGGWMYVALYSYAARAGVRLARERIKSMGYHGTASDMRKFRHYVMQHPEDELYQICIGVSDFYMLSNCRDYVFHVQEHQHTIPQLKELIAPLQLEFMGFQLDYRAVRGVEPRITDWRSLDQWHRFEQAHPKTFLTMYGMWLKSPTGIGQFPT